MSPYDDEDQKYYDAVDQEDASFRLNAYSLNETQPVDKVARALELSQKNGLPRVAIESDMEGYEAQDEYDRLRQLGVTAPQLYKWLSQTPDNYAVTKDEADLWGSVEKQFSGFAKDPIGQAKRNYTNIGRSLAAGFMSAESSIADADREQLEKAARYYDDFDAWKAREAERVAAGKGGFINRLGFNTVDVGTLRMQLPGDTDPMPQPTMRLLDEAANRNATAFEKFLGIPGADYKGSQRDVVIAIKPLIQDKMREAVRVSEAKSKAVEEMMPQTGDFVADSLLGGVRAISEMTPLIVSAIASRGKTIPTVVMTGQVYYNEYATGREKGLEIDQATERAVLQAGVESISERISLGIIDNVIKDGGPLALRFTKGIILEQGQEQVATMGGRLVDWAYLEKDKTIQEFIDETPRAMLQTALTTLVASSGMQATFLAADYATQKFLGDSVMTDPSKGDQFIANVMEKFAKANLGKRSPEKAAELVNKIVEGTGAETVVVDLDGLAQSLTTAGMDVREVLTQLGVDPDAIGELGQLMGTAEIPMGRLATPSAQLLSSQIIPHMRLATESLTPFQKTELEDIAEMAKRYATDVKEDVARDASKLGAFVDVQEQIYTAAKGSGLNLTEEQYRHNANIAATNVAYIAMKRGQDVRETWAELGPKIMGRDGAQPQTQGRAALESAQKSGYQGSDRGEAESWLRAVEKGLDMSTEGRMARAKEMGFDVDSPLYHGTDADITAFRTSRGGTFGEGVYLSDAQHASMYADMEDGANVIPVYVKGKIATEADIPIELSQGREIADWAYDNGYDGYTHTYWPGGGTETVIFNPKNIRSVHAAFDPDQADSADLLASTLPNSMSGIAKMTTEQMGEWYVDNVQETRQDFPDGTSRITLRFKTDDAAAAQDSVVILQVENGKVSADLVFRGTMGGPALKLPPKPDVMTPEQEAERAAIAAEINTRRNSATQMFGKAIVAMRHWAALEQPSAMTFSGSSVDHEKLYNFFLSRMEFEGYTNHVVKAIIGGITTRTADQSNQPVTSGETFVGPMVKFVVLKDGEDLSSYAETEASKGRVGRDLDGNPTQGYRAVTTREIGPSNSSNRGVERGGLRAGGSDPGGDGTDAENLTQPRRGGYDPKTREMSFTGISDASTFLHENSHWFLATLEELAPTEKWAADDLAEINRWYQSVRETPKMTEIRLRYSVIPEGEAFRIIYDPPADMIGNRPPPMKLERVASMEEAQAKIEWRERQEAWAETTEEYFMTGESPTPRLKQILRDFKNWLVQVYKGMLPGERANLTPEIRSMMDRILAVDVEVDAASAEVFRNARKMADEMLGKGIITPRQHRLVGDRLDKAREEVKEEMLARVMQEKLEAGQASRATERTIILGDLARAFDKSPVGRAFNWLAYGEWMGDLPNEPGTAAPEPESARSDEMVFQLGRFETPGSPQYEAAVRKFGVEGMVWQMPDGSDGPRKARARAMGYNVDNVLYHGTDKDFEAFRTSIGTYGEGVYLTDGAELAGRYASGPRLDRQGAPRTEGSGPNIIATYARGKIATIDDFYNALEIARSERPDINETTAIRSREVYRLAGEVLKARGFAGHRLQEPNAQFAKAIVIYDPANVRSVNAAFDPDNSESAVLLGQEQRKVDTSVAGGLTEKSFIRTRDLEGATIFPMFADLTDAGSTFAALDGLPIAPTPYLGGPNFPWLKSYRENGIVWAFNKPGVITKVRNKVKALQKQARAEGRSGRIVITMLAMKDDAHTSNEMVVSALLRTLDAVVEAGRFPQEQLAEAKRLIVSKAGKKDEGYPELATFPGFGDAQALHDWSRGATFAGRKALAKEMRSVKFQQLPGMFPVERIVREAIDPDYRATQQGDALLAFEIDPDADDLIIDFDDPRSGNIPRHPAYRYGMRGELVGSFSTHIPMEVLYGDMLPKIVARAKEGANPKFLMERLKTGDGQVVTEDIIREAEVIEGLHDYRIAQAHAAGIAVQWRSSDVAANKGGVNPVEFERALLESDAAATLTKYTREDVTKGKKKGALRVFQLGDARVQDGGLNVWMAVKKGYDYRNEYPGKITDALVEQGILTDNEVALVGVANNELGVSGMATFQVLKGIEEGVTVLDAFKVTSPSKPDGLLPTIYATLGFEEVGQIPFDPQYYDAQQLADLKAIWTRQGWNEADGYPAVAIMKWRGDDAIRPEATRRFILESQEGLGIGSTPDVAAIEASTESVRDSDGPSDQGDGLPGQGDGRADPRRFADRARGVSGTVRGYVENILAADARAIKALKLSPELIGRIREEYGPALAAERAAEPPTQGPTNETLSQTKAPTFYSALSRFIENSKVASATGAEWKQLLVQPAHTVRSAQRDPATNRVVLGDDGKPVMLERTVPEVFPPNVKPEEIEWTGVMEWLDLQEGPVTREAVAAFVAANGVTVEEVVKGGGVLPDAEEYQRQLLPLIERRDEVTRQIDAEYRDPDGPDLNLISQLENEDLSLQRQIDELENYSGLDGQSDDTKWSSYTLPGGENYTEVLLTVPGLDYEDDHFKGVKGTIAHVRYKERIGPNGERVLALEEVQSGIHQKGREEGYQDPKVMTDARAEADKASADRAQAFEDMKVALVREDVQKLVSSAGTQQERDIVASLVAGQVSRDPMSIDIVVNAVTAHMRNPRLSEESRAAMKGSYEAFRAATSMFDVATRYTRNLSLGIPNAPFKNNAWVELVLKRMVRYAAENGFDTVAWIPGNIQNGKVVEADDNRSDFYDKILPNIANKFGKKYGARVSQTEIAEAELPHFPYGRSNGMFVVHNDNGQRVSDTPEFESRQEALNWIAEQGLNNQSWWTLPITPQLREAALNEGFPLFQPRRFNPPGHGAIAPPTDIPPVRLDLKLVKDLYGEEAVRKLPAAVRRRSSTSSNVSDIIQQIEAVRKVLSVKRKGPQTLTQFILQRSVKQQDGSKRNRQWGIKGAAGELRAMGLERLINEKSGMPIDAMRELAEEAGFIRAETGGARATEYGDLDATPNDLLDALAREAKGEPVVRIGEEVDNKELDDAKAWASWLEQNGVDIYETDQRKLRASVDQMLRDSDESLVSPDKAAEMFGFANGEELLKALAEVGNRDAFLNKMADQKMVEEFGDMMTDGTLQAEAAEAARLDIAHRQNEIEMEALARALGQQASANYAKSLAKDIIAMRTVKEIAAYERDLNNERQFGKQALRLVEKGDYPAALKAKQRQLVSMQLYTEGKKAHERIEKQRQDLLKYYTSEGRRDKIAADYLEQIEAVLDDFELRVSKQGPKEQRTRNSAAEYVAAMTLQGREAEIAPEAMLLAGLNEKMVWRNMTAAEVEHLVGTIQNLAHLGRTKDGLMKAQEKRKFRAVVSTLVERLRAAPSHKDRSVPFSPTLTDQGFAVLRYWDSKWAKIEDQMALLDGSSAGPLVDTLVQPFAEADAREGIMLTELTRQLRGLHKTLTERENRQLVGRRVSTPELALPGNRQMTMMDVLVIGMNWGNAGNREALTVGYGWKDEDVEAVLNRYLTDSHWNFIEGAWGIVEGLKPEAFAVEKRVTGVEPKAVIGITFTLASGRKIEGKYFPLKYDGAQAGAISARHGRKEEADLLKEIGMSFTKPMTRTGHTIERVGSGGKPVKIAMETLFNHLENVVHDITHREALIDAVRIIKDPEFITAYQNAAGLEQYNRLMPWLTDIATKNGARDRGMFAGVMSHLRAGTSATLMGFKFGTAIQQFTGWAEAVPEIGLDWVLRGMVKTYAGGPITFFQQWQFVNSKSDYLMTRLQFGKHRDVRAQTTKVGDRTPLREIQDSQFMFLSGLDAFIGTSVWVSSYDKAVAGKVKDIAAGDEEAAVAFADRIVRFSLSSSETYALPEMMRGSEMDKWLTAIYTYGAKQYNRTRTKMYQVRYGQIGIPEFTAAMFVMHAVLPIMAAFLAARLLPGDDEEEEVLLENAGTEVMMNLAGMFPLFRDVVGTFIKPEFGYQMSPVEGSMEKVIGASRRAAEGESLQSEAGAKELVFALGVVFKLPGTQLWVTGEYAYDVATGAEDPLEDPVDAVSEGLIRNTR